MEGVDIMAGDAITKIILEQEALTIFEVAVFFRHGHKIGIDHCSVIDFCNDTIQ